MTAIAQTSSIEAFRAGVPGVYPDVPADVYHALDACSASRLKKLAKSAAHCRQSIDFPDDDDTEAKALGSAEHVCILEPEMFAQRYVIGPDVDLRTKIGKERWLAFQSEHPGRCCLRSKDGDDLMRMYEAVWVNPAAAKAIRSCSRRELSVVWRDKDTRMLCKLRADLLGDVMFDVKTTTDASDIGFASAARRFKYDLQAAFYLRGVAAAGISCDGFGFIAVEKNPPAGGGVGVYAIDDIDLIDADLDIFRPDGLLAQYAKCVRDDEWPGYSNNMRVLRLPPKRKDATA